MAGLTIKDLSVVWPFLREMLYGDSDLATVVRRNKVAAFFIIASGFLFVALAFMTEQAMQQHDALLATNKKYERLELKLQPYMKKGSTPDEYVDKAIQLITDLQKTNADLTAKAPKTDTSPITEPVASSKPKRSRKAVKVVGNINDQLNALRSEERK